MSYDKFHQRNVRSVNSFTIATPLETQGDFTELNGGVGTGGLSGTGANNPAFLFDPTSTTCTGNVCTRQPFQAIKNGVLTNNIIPSSYISPFAKAAQQYLPAPTNPSTLTNNYSSGYPGGFDNHAVAYRVDFDMTPKHRLSTIGAMGSVNYTNNASTPYLPQPYTGGDGAAIFPKIFAVEDAYTISNSLVNQLKFGFVRFYMNIYNTTQNTPYSISNLGVTNLPQGQAGQEFPGISFATTGAFTNAVTTWTGNTNAISTQLTTPNNYTIVDNIQYVKGKHAVTAGIQVQWQQVNNANPATYSGILSLPTTGFATANYTANSNALSSTSGYSYASFLLGAIGNTTANAAPSLALQPVSEVGGRYRPIAPYVEDTWKVNSKLTIDAGLRWDYLPPYHEVKDRWSFLNPTATNPATGTPGLVEFAGNYGGSATSCNCRTPVQTYWKNFGPRVGITFQADDKTVFRAGIGRVFSQGGGVGGRAGAYQGTGQLGFNVTATGASEVTTGAGASPSFYLNNSSYFQQVGLANTDLFGKNYQYPTAPSPGVATQILNAGNYVNAAGKVVSPSTAPGYADPYFSGRAPDFTFYNVGMQRALTNSLTMSINYAGNQAHHLYNSTAGGANIRGYWANQLDPRYLVGLGAVTDSTGTKPILISAATAANVAKAQTAMPGVNIAGSFQAAAAISASATIAQGLVAFPQYSSTADTWGVNTANFSYNSLQVTVEQRMKYGFTFNFNYTWSRNIGDDGTFRSGFDIPQAAISGGTMSWHQDRIERGPTTTQQAHVIHSYGAWKMPFGTGRLGGDHALTRTLLGGWTLSYVATYGSGTPTALTSSACTTSTSPLQGQCMPDVNPTFTKNNAHINGGFGRNAAGQRTACNLGVGTGCVAVPYFDKTAFSNPGTVGGSNIYLLGNAPRTAALHLNNPPNTNLDTSIRKAIPFYHEMALVLQADCFNTFNHTTFNTPSAAWANNSASFGTVTSLPSSYTPRTFQVAAHFNF